MRCEVCGDDCGLELFDVLWMGCRMMLCEGCLFNLRGDYRVVSRPAGWRRVA